MTRLLLFGASGFIGSQVRRALEADADLVCPGRAECDLAGCDREDLRDLVAAVRPRAVVSCVGATVGSAAELVRANTLSAAKLVDAVAVAAPRARLVRLGSAAEYGPVPFGTSVTEDTPPRPVSDYGISQAAATRFVELAARTGRVDPVVLRVFNPIGPGLPRTTLLGRVAASVARLAPGADLPTGPLDAHRDFVDVRDVAAAVRAAVSVPAPAARVVNIGSGRAVPVREAVRLLVRTAGAAVEVRENRPPSPRSAAVDWVRADIRRAATVLGWTPRHELTDSIRMLWHAVAAESAVPDPVRAGRTGTVPAPERGGPQKEEQMT
ncbi:NAD-dependent epimerase/dehydratase family protein [Micromonospora sp. C28SCA-DRY-2]|uniref:NAD-dependent epimerase/dehydratase family protein n=1 Tax=Micromonospora sp. C28SCA-DRY-2 TaxID=3059522 RepID=UPI0026758AC3|nr:NAD-dependent epimerase/dehydratase family protein [Micromonospora sp. C28SCA-DRY-2]MDO3705940.1 NAD-dependent epimerase/dehydratase family protein [Micromonospora sp. C28SCA-DRY-2]